MNEPADIEDVRGSGLGLEEVQMEMLEAAYLRWRAEKRKEDSGELESWSPTDFPLEEARQIVNTFEGWPEIMSRIIELGRVQNTLDRVQHGLWYPLASDSLQEANEQLGAAIGEQCEREAEKDDRASCFGR